MPYMDEISSQGKECHLKYNVAGHCHLFYVYLLESSKSSSRCKTIVERAKQKQIVLMRRFAQAALLQLTRG